MMVPLRYAGRISIACGAALFMLILVALSAAAQPADDPYEAGPFDFGKMWTFDYPPVEYLRETYDFHPDEAWFEAARLGALRIPGCTASFVSGNGLVMTNHHCGRSHVTNVTQPGENLIDTGFYARSLDEERPAPSMYADQLIAIEDVTDEVYAALEGSETDAERAQARQDAIAAIQNRLVEAAGGADAGIRVEVISLYHGGRYSAYTFRRYTDVRLVMTPELQLGYYGGDPDNFTYPRYALDVTFFRVYNEDGEPLQTDQYFSWADEGVQEGTLVFVIGNPGSTYRLETVAQLEFRRDVREPAVLRLYGSRATAYQQALNAHPDAPGMDNVQNLIFSFHNGEKLYEGRVKALNDELIMARKKDAEEDLQDAIQADANLDETYGKLIDQMAEVQRQKREVADPYRAFFGFGSPVFSSPTLLRGYRAYRYLTQQAQGVTGEALDPVKSQLLAVVDQPPGVDEALLAARLADVATYFGQDEALTQAILQGRSPAAAAKAIIDASVLADSAQTAEAVNGGTLSMDDPAVQAAAAFADVHQDFQSAWAGLTARENELAGDIGRARFEVYGTSLPPDATFSLRLADGVVKGYDYNGTVAPPYTTIYGLYDHYYSYGPDTPWDLPERWLTPPETFDLSTPMNFVATADITGGNSGSPVINRELEVVGIVFDGNIESLSGDYIYLPETNRAVAVDARGILEALDDMYDADRLVLELRGKAFVPTEEEADAVSSSQ